MSHATTERRAKPFTEEQMQQVFDTNIIDFAVQQGFEIEEGDRKTMHVKHSGGLYLFKHGRGYYQFSGGQHGNIIQFVQEYMGIRDFKEAVELILHCRSNRRACFYIAPTEERMKGELKLPEKDADCNRVIAYLTCTRGIDREIVVSMIAQNKIYQAVTRKGPHVFRNCAFVGYDNTGKSAHCSLRSMEQRSQFRQDIKHSNKAYGFVMEGASNRIYEFEAPIDAMSHATLCKLYGIDWRQDHRLAEYSLSDKALSRYLKRHPEIQEIVFCYDNDMSGKDSRGQPHNHGQIQAQRSANTFQKQGYKVWIQTPENKDFNQDLIALREKTH